MFSMIHAGTRLMAPGGYALNAKKYSGVEISNHFQAIADGLRMHLLHVLDPGHLILERFLAMRALDHEITSCTSYEMPYSN